MSFIRRSTFAITTVALLIAAGVATSIWLGNSEAEQQLADIVINEVVTSNRDTVADEDNEYSDWIEIQNRSTRDIDISTYVLARDGDVEWQLPERIIKAGEYLVIFASGKNRISNELHTNFRLSRNGVTLSLENRSSRDSTSLDFLSVPSLARNASYGKDPTNPQRTCHFAFPSPGEVNVEECFDDISLGAPQLSQESGFYDNGFTLTMTPGISGAQLYYTLDGTYPDPIRNASRTRVYTGPIEITELPAKTGPLSRIDSTITDRTMTFARLFTQVPPYADDIRPATVIRVRSQYSVETSATYFVGPEFRSNIPVVSLILNPDHLFDFDTGIYIAGATFDRWRNSSEFSPNSRWGTPANYNQRGREWERPFTDNTVDAVRLQTCTSAGCQSTMNVGIRINGNASRIQPMHALRILARDDYGDSTFTQDWFGDGAKGWKSLVLRNGGNNYRGYGDRFHFNDGFFQSAMTEMNLATQAFQPMNVFINGEYWGVHNLRERYDTRYFTVRFGVDEDNVATVDSVFTADAPEEIFEEWKGFPEYFRKLRSDPVNGVNEIENLVDIDSFFDFIIANTYAGNTDWPGNNTRMWRSIKPRDEVGAGAEDGRWRWMLMDLDRIGGTPLARPKVDNLESFDKISPSSNLYQARLLHSLLQFPALKQRFFDRYEERLSSLLDAIRMESRLDEFARVLGPEMEKHARRWSLFDAPIGTNTWNERVDNVRTFVKQRPQVLREYLQYLRSRW
jgi:hypothetical protein